MSKSKLDLDFFKKEVFAMEEKRIKAPRGAFLLKFNSKFRAFMLF